MGCFGSTCGKLELEWLQVDFQDNIDINAITKATKDVEDIHDHKLLKAAMEVSWQDVKNGYYPPLIRMFYEPLKQLGARPIDSYASSPLIPYDTVLLRPNTPTTPTSCSGDCASASSSPTRHDLPNPSKTVSKAAAKRIASNSASPALPKILPSTPAPKSPARRLMNDLLEAASRIPLKSAQRDSIAALI